MYDKEEEEEKKKKKKSSIQRTATKRVALDSNLHDKDVVYSVAIKRLCCLVCTDSVASSASRREVGETPSRVPCTGRKEKCKCGLSTKDVRYFALLGCYAALIGSYRRFGNTLSVQSSRVSSLRRTLKIGAMGCAETSVTGSHSVPANILEE